MKYDAARIDELRGGGMGLLEAKKRARYEHLMSSVDNMLKVQKSDRGVYLRAILIDIVNEIFNEA
jgi:hypothetical protein